MSYDNFANAWFTSILIIALSVYVFYIKRKLLPKEANKYFRYTYKMFFWIVIILLDIYSTSFIMQAQDRALNVKIGYTKNEVLSHIGKPDLVCSSNIDMSMHKARGRNPNLLFILKNSTSERWIYYTTKSNKIRETVKSVNDCLPIHWDIDIGFDERGKVLWYVYATKESRIVYY